MRKHGTLSSKRLLSIISIFINVRECFSFLSGQMHRPFQSFPPSCNKDLVSSTLNAAKDFHTAYEYIARQKGDKYSSYVSWLDPSEYIIPSPPKPKERQMGFQIDRGIEDETDIPDNTEILSEKVNTFRLPIYPVSAVHLPSSATQTLHNTQMKNVKMSRDLKDEIWNVDTKDLFQNDERSEKQLPCFVLTLFAQDTFRLASSGTLMEVISMEDTYDLDKKLIRVVVKCKAVGIVDIEGFEQETIEKENEYLIGRVKLRGIEHDNIHSTIDEENKEAKALIQRVTKDYNDVRDMYTNTESIASKELPPYARDAVQANIIECSEDDFLHESRFWDVAECWQMLCNTIKDARRVDLQSDVNEIMIDAASKKKGPLKLPIKRHELPDDVQSKIIKMEQEASEDFLSCGLDPAIDFQLLMGVGREGNIDSNQVHLERIIYLAEMIKREKDRLEVKEKLKNIFVDDTKEEISNKQDFWDKFFE